MLSLESLSLAGCQSRTTASCQLSNPRSRRRHTCTSTAQLRARHRNARSLPHRRPGIRCHRIIAVEGWRVLAVVGRARPVLVVVLGRRVSAASLRRGDGDQSLQQQHPWCRGNHLPDGAQRCCVQLDVSWLLITHKQSSGSNACFQTRYHHHHHHDEYFLITTLLSSRSTWLMRHRAYETRPHETLRCDMRSHTSSDCNVQATIIFAAFKAR